MSRTRPAIGLPSARHPPRRAARLSVRAQARRGGTSLISLMRPRPRPRGVLAAAACLVALTIQVPSDAAAPAPAAGSGPILPADGYGFSDGISILTLSDADLATELDAVASTTATWLRVPLDWPSIERARGRLDWSAPDRVIAAARARGLKVLAVVGYTPSWARGFWTRQTAPPTDASLYGGFTRQAAQHYGSAVAAYELWNEPNRGATFGGNVDAAKFAELLKAGYAGIRAVDRSVPVVSGGLSPGGTDPARFLTALYRHGAGGSFDAVGLHPYIGSGDPTRTTRRMSAMIASLRSVLDAHRATTAKIWLTEFGTASYVGGPSRDRQADAALEQLRVAAETPLIGPCILYEIRDAGPSTSTSNGFGHLLTWSWDTKPLLRILAG